MKPIIPFVCLCLALAACSRGGDNAERKQSAAPVRLTVARTRDVPVQIESVGYVSASNKVSVRSRVMGHLLEVRFAEGDDVREGQVLFVLDERPFAASLREARARLERGRAQMLKARDDMRRLQGLSSKGFTSQDQYEQARTDALALEATVMADEAAVEQAKLQLDYCTITAPISGRAGVVLQNKGNLIKANDDSPMLSIDCLEPIYVYFAVPEIHLPAIRSRTERETVATRILPQGSPRDQAVTGALSFIDNSVDMRTGTIRLRAEVPNADRRLWPGQFVSVSLVLGEQKDAVVVPSAAVLNGPGGAYVYVADGDNKAQYRMIKTSVEYADLIVVTEGLAAGERVVTEGQVRLGPGVQVEDVAKGAQPS